MNVNFSPGDIYTDHNNRISYVRLSNGRWRIISTDANASSLQETPKYEGAALAPKNPAVGQTWVETRNDEAVPYVWDGDEWLQISPSISEGTDLGSF